MSIQKKSLISTLKTTKKANVAKEDFSQAGASAPSMKSATRKIHSGTRKIHSGTRKA
jgi:hypothetical protein